MYKLIMLAFVLFAGTLPLLAQSKSEDWSGFYIGGNVSASSDKSDAAASLQINQISNLFVTGRGLVVVPGTTRDFAASKRETKTAGGFQGGYQWQSSNFVGGFEADFNPFKRTVSVTQSLQLPTTILEPAKTINVQRDVRLNNEFSINGRAGAAFGKGLVYGTGGFSNAQARVASIDSYSNPGGTAPSGCGTAPNICFNSGPEGPVVTTARVSQNMNGWNVGGGFAYRLSKRFDITVEYRHTDLGSKTLSTGTQTTVNTGPETKGDNGAVGLVGNVATGPTTFSLKSDAVSFRFNFHF